MSDWLSYSLHDLLIFSPEAYAGLFESYNKALWPYQVPLVMASLVLLVGLRLKPAAFGKITLVSLALAWLFVGLWFIEGYYSQLNPMAESFIYFFVIQAVFLFWASINTNPQVFSDFDKFDKKPIYHLGWVVLIYAYFLHPLLLFQTGRQFNGLEFLFVAPDATAIATLGFLLVIRPKAYALLMVMPLLWLLLSLLTYMAF